MCKFVCQDSVPLAFAPRSWPSASSTGSHHRRGPRQEVPLAPLLVHQAVFPTAPLPFQMQLISITEGCVGFNVFRKALYCRTSRPRSRPASVLIILDNFLSRVMRTILPLHFFLMCKQNDQQDRSSSEQDRSFSEPWQFDELGRCVR